MRPILPLSVAIAALVLGTQSVGTEVPPAASTRCVDPVSQGADPAVGNDDTAAILAATLDAGDRPLCFGVGEFAFTVTLTHREIEGVSREKTILRYTGLATAIGVIDPNVRSHNKRIENLTLLSPAASGLDGVTPTGDPQPAVGIDLASHSRGHFSNLLVAGFNIGVWIHGPLLNAYNVFHDVTVGGSHTCYQLDSYNTNENAFVNSRANVCSNWGWFIWQGDGNTITAGAVESSANGIRIRGVDADYNSVTATRFENVDGYGLYVGSEAPRPKLIGNRIYPSGGAVYIGSPTAVNVGN